MRDRKSMDSHRIDELIDELIGESPETATHVPASIQRAGAAWYKTKKAMDDLAVKMEYLKDQKKEIEKDLISAIEAMQDQRLRVDDVYITLSRRVSPSYGKAFENACALLKSVSERLYEKAVEFSGEVASETKLLLVRKAEASVFDRLKGLVSRIWDWLKQTDRDIARLEKAAYFEEEDA